MPSQRLALIARPDASPATGPEGLRELAAELRTIAVGAQLVADALESLAAGPAPPEEAGK